MRISAIRTVTSCSKSSAIHEFYGIGDITTKDVAGLASNTKLEESQRLQKFKPLTIPRKKLEREETLSNKNFGTIRYDIDNVPKRHGQFDISNNRTLYDTVDIKTLYEDDNKTAEVKPQIVKFKSSLKLATTKIKTDSKGFHNYQTQVEDWSKYTHSQLLEVIKKSVIYNNYDILAVNKPYGISSHGGNENNDSINMNSLVGEIAKSLKIEKIHLAHRLDKTTTGVLLFATSESRARNLNKLFKSDEIKKTYWCITKGVPDPLAAIIDIPIAEFRVAGKARSCIAPTTFNQNKQLSQDFRLAHRAITEYRTLNHTKDTALVEVKPRSGVKHQIRCHLAFAISRPILGDHKYSHIGKVAPQKLPVAVLNSLQLRQTKVRTLPLHLHSKTVVIPGAKANGETLFIQAPLPSHFIENMRALKLMDEKIKERC